MKILRALFVTIFLTISVTPAIANTGLRPVVGSKGDSVWVHRTIDKGSTAAKQIAGARGPSLVKYTMACQESEQDMQWFHHCSLANENCVARFGEGSRWVRVMLTALNPDGSPTGAPPKTVHADCMQNPPPNNAQVVSMSLEQFESLKIDPVAFTIELPGGRLPAGTTMINMVNPVVAQSKVVYRDTELLTSKVKVRATPTWLQFTTSNGDSFGVGVQGETTKTQVKFTARGWQQVSVTATYAGEFSMDGVTWFEIPGTITVESPKQAVYTYIGVNQLVDPNAPMDNSVPAPPPNPYR